MSTAEKAGTSRVVPVEERPFNAEAPMDVLAEALTPVTAFYVRNHFDVPSLEAERWRLQVGGAVRCPLSLSLADLRRFPQRSLTVTLECAGNGRVVLEPAPEGTPWRYGAVSTGTFTGALLKDVLQRAGPGDGVVEVLFVGADEGEVEPGRREPFARSLPLAEATEGGAILAWALNGGPLSAEHGHPVRLVVPRWYAVASVKWLVAIEALREPFAGYYQRERYVYVGQEGTPDGTPVTTVRTRAVIGRPADGAEVSGGPVEVAGTAWTGDGDIRQVEVSPDGGRSWRRAELGRALSPHAARPWRLEWTPPGPGTYELLARATDTRGRAQPLEPVWNLYGYGNNVAHRVRITVR